MFSFILILLTLGTHFAALIAAVAAGISSERKDESAATGPFLFAWLLLTILAICLYKAALQ